MNNNSSSTATATTAPRKRRSRGGRNRRRSTTAPAATTTTTTTAARVAQAVKQCLPEKSVPDELFDRSLDPLEMVEVDLNDTGISDAELAALAFTWRGRERRLSEQVIATALRGETVVMALGLARQIAKLYQRKLAQIRQVILAMLEAQAELPTKAQVAKPVAEKTVAFTKLDQPALQAFVVDERTWLEMQAAANQIAADVIARINLERGDCVDPAETAAAASEVLVYFAETAGRKRSEAARLSGGEQTVREYLARNGIIESRYSATLEPAAGEFDGYALTSYLAHGPQLVPVGVEL